MRTNGNRLSPPPPPSQRVYVFGKARSEGSAAMKQLLGGKGANLAEMSRIGLDVPPGLTLTTDTCAEYVTLCAHANVE